MNCAGEEDFGLCLDEDVEDLAALRFDVCGPGRVDPDGGIFTDDRFFHGVVCRGCAVGVGEVERESDGGRDDDEVGCE